MKKQNIFYLGGFILFAALCTGIFFFQGKKKDEILPLKERTGALATAPEWKKTKEMVGTLIEKIKNNPKDVESKLQLVSAYLGEGRITGDRQYYDMAALKVLNNILAKDPMRFEALCFKANVELSQHHFKEGLETAQTAVSVNPDAAYVYGLLVDGNVELGRYADAVKNADKMASIRPDLSSYSRVSYLREIYGDINGAIDAMRMATEAGFPGLEETAWTRVQMGKLYEMKGRTDSAKYEYEVAMSQRPDYPYAISGLARIARTNNDLKTAIELTKKASQMVPDYGFLDQLAEMQTLAGKENDAKETINTLIEKLTADAQSGNNNDQIGHYSDKELAYAYLKIKNVDKALEHALIEYNRRPNNIDVNEALAWVYYKKGDFQKASSYIDVSLNTKCKNPELLCRAGLIKTKAGDNKMGAELLKQGTENNPTLSSELLAEVKPFLVLK